MFRIEFHMYETEVYFAFAQRKMASTSGSISKWLSPFLLSFLWNRKLQVMEIYVDMNDQPSPQCSFWRLPLKIYTDSSLKTNLTFQKNMTLAYLPHSASGVFTVRYRRQQQVDLKFTFGLHLLQMTFSLILPFRLT